MVSSILSVLLFLIECEGLCITFKVPPFCRASGEGKSEKCFVIAAPPEVQRGSHEWLERDAVGKREWEWRKRNYYSMCGYMVT